MALTSYVPMFFLAISLFFFISARNKKYSLLRREESKRYFSGSVVDDNDNELYKERNYTKGLSLSKDGDGISFKKQAKMCDTAILY